MMSQAQKCQETEAR